MMFTALKIDSKNQELGPDIRLLFFWGGEGSGVVACLFRGLSTHPIASES